MLNILFCGDSGVCKGIFLSALSVCNCVNENVNFYILTASTKNKTAIDNNFIRKLEKSLLKKNPDHKVYLFDITKQFNNCLPVANMNTRFTPLCMLRLFADTLPQIPNRILYLDTDVLCRRDFRDMYYSNISKVEICGVADRYGKWFLGNVFKHNYLNSGVLLMNMQNIRKSGLFKKCRQLCKTKKMFLPDQSAINKLAVKSKIETKYNEQGKIKSDTVFKHFTAFFKFFPYVKTVTVKPWQTKEMHSVLGIYEFDDIIKEYENEQRNTHIFYN